MRCQICFLPCTLSHTTNGECAPSSQSSKPGKNTHGRQEQGFPPQGEAKGILRIMAKRDARDTRSAVSLEVSLPLGEIFFQEHERVHVLEGIYTTGESLGINNDKSIVN